jgi:hypothetical protein
MITRDLILDDAQRLGVEPDAVLAVAEVESAGSGFLADGRPAILFEAQWFHKFTGGRYDASNPDISSPVWNRSLYRGGVAEYDRLNEAMALDAEAAFKSASYGLFQIMGFNYAACGFPNVMAYWDAMKKGENEQIEAFTNFINDNPGLRQALQFKDWASFARLYNGPGAVAQYSGRISAAYQMHVRGVVARPQGLLAIDGPPIPDADPSGPPTGYRETATGNVVREDVRQSDIVKGANNGLTIGGVAAAAGTAAPVVSAFGALDWKMAAVICAGLFGMGLLFVLWRLLEAKQNRINMNRDGIA